MTGRRFVRGRALRGLVALSALALALVLLPGGFAAKSSSRAAMAAPPGFQPQTVVSGLNLPTSFAFTPDGRIFIAEKNGVVRVFKNGALLPTPLIDISAKVNNYWDRGLIGMALDPNFATNGYIYLLYPYEATATDDAGGKTARLSRYTVVGDTASPATETVLLGTNAGSACTQFPVGSDCIPAEWYGHGVGDIQFGSDGSMFLSNGDASNWNVVNDDALRAQSLDSLAGKIMRIDPEYRAGPAGQPVLERRPERCAIEGVGVRRPQCVPLLGPPEQRRRPAPSMRATSAGAHGGGRRRSRRAPISGGRATRAALVQAGYQFKPVCQALYTAVAADPSKWTKPIITWDHNGAGSAVTGGAFNTGTAYPARLPGRLLLRRLRAQPAPLCEHRHERRRHIRADRLRSGRRLAGRHPGRTGRQPLLPGDRLGTADQVRIRRSPVRVPAASSATSPGRRRRTAGGPSRRTSRTASREPETAGRSPSTALPTRRASGRMPLRTFATGSRAARPSQSDIGIDDEVGAQRIGRLPGVPGRDEGVRQRHDERRIRDQERQPRPDRKERASSRRHERRRQRTTTTMPTGPTPRSPAPAAAAAAAWVPHRHLVPRRRFRTARHHTRSSPPTSAGTGSSTS